MSLNIVRVLALPGTLAPNTIYLVAKSATELQVVTVGNTAADVRSTIIGSDVDSKISTAIGNLDLSNSAGFVNTIAERNALAPTKNSFVLVADATGDATVGAGAALYFFNVVSSTWIKVAEYESMDVVIPNKQILTDLSDVAGQLYYKGTAIGTVQAGTMEW